MTTNSETSTDPPPSRSHAGFQPWQFYILLSMIGATAAVIVTRQTHPAALLLLSAAVVAAGLVGLAFHHALAGFFGHATPGPPVSDGRARERLLREKMLVLRSIKELEFDRRMGKVSEVDFNEISGRLRARALALMQVLERTEPSPISVEERVPDLPGTIPATAAPGTCGRCGTSNDPDAKFCKQCGVRLAKT